MDIIRLQKKNRKKFTKSWFIVVINKEKSSNSKNIKEKIGHYNQETGKLILNINKFIFWLSKNVKMSDRFVFLLKKTNNIFANPQKKFTNLIITKKC